VFCWHFGGARIAKGLSARDELVVGGLIVGPATEGMGHRGCHFEGIRGFRGFGGFWVQFGIIEVNLREKGGFETVDVSLACSGLPVKLLSNAVQG
jgi:hypothetical protein